MDSSCHRYLQRKTAVLVLSLLVLSACSNAVDAPGDESPAGPINGGAESIARETVARQLEIDYGRTRIVESEARQFSDASLDCPEPGMMYAQVITPGYRVIVEADGRRFDVRVAGGSGRICHRPRRERSDRPADDLAQRIDRARVDLARQLGEEPRTIRLVARRPVVAGAQPADCRLDCTGEGADACGDLFTFDVDGRHYRYRSHGDQLLGCETIARR